MENNKPAGSIGCYVIRNDNEEGLELGEFYYHK